MAVKQFCVRDPKGRLRTVNASTTKGAMAVYVKNTKTVVPGDHEVRELGQALSDWDVFYVKGDR